MASTVTAPEMKQEEQPTLEREVATKISRARTVGDMVERLAFGGIDGPIVHEASEVLLQLLRDAEDAAHRLADPPPEPERPKIAHKRARRRRVTRNRKVRR